MLTTLATAAITLVVVNDFTGKHTDNKEIKFSSYEGLGQLNLKTGYFKETIVSGYFLGWSSAIFVFFCSTLSII
jgi:hypothetical protein